METEYGKCAKCPFKQSDRICTSENDRHPDNCSSLLYKDIIEYVKQRHLDDPDLMEFARQASLQEASCYSPSDIDPEKMKPVKCRIQETFEFCKRMGYKKLGLGFCMGLFKEATALNNILENQGFEVVSVGCKVGGIDKSFLGLSPEEKVVKGCPFEPACDPVAQAMIFNKEKVDFVIAMGLCVGHDTMLIKYTEAPMTIVAVKDRLLGHNPLAALYTNYYSYLK